MTQIASFLPVLHVIFYWLMDSKYLHFPVGRGGAYTREKLPRGVYA